MKYKKTFVLALFLVSLISCNKKYYAPPPELSIPKLDTKFEKCAGTKIGRDYIESVSMTFLNTANFDSCFLKGDPTHKPIAIYFDVDAVGKVGKVIIKPNSLLTYCVKENVNNLALTPPPSSDCTVRIILSFEEDSERSEKEEEVIR